MLTTFGRHRAPVLQGVHLAGGEHAFILMGLIPNRKGQPLLIDWRVAVHRAKSWSLESFPDFLGRTGLRAGALSNRNQTLEPAELQAILPDAVPTMRHHLVHRQRAFAAGMDSRLAGTLADPERAAARAPFRKLAGLGGAWFAGLSTHASA